MSIKLVDRVHRPDAAYWTVKDLKYLLSFNPDVAVAQSPRAYGKSYTGMEYCQYEYLDKGIDVVWGRYNKTELSNSITAWKKYNPEIEAIKGEQSNIKWYIQPSTGARIGFFTWSISQNIKGMDGDFGAVVCDEFVPDTYNKNRPRLDSEFSAWNSVYQSLNRTHGMKVIMLSNNVYWNNPFFIGWDIPPFPKGKVCVSDQRLRVKANDGTEISTDRRIVIENIAGTDAIIRRTIKEKALEFKTDKELEAYYNNSTKAEYTALGICPRLQIPLSRVQIMSQGYYMNHRNMDGLLYFTHVRPDYGLETIVSEIDYIDNTKKHHRDPYYLMQIERAFNDSRCIFDSQETLVAFLRWLRQSRNRL